MLFLLGAFLWAHADKRGVSAYPCILAQPFEAPLPPRPAGAAASAEDPWSMTRSGLALVTHPGHQANSPGAGA